MEVLIGVIVVGVVGGSLAGYVWLARARAQEVVQTRPRRRIANYDELKQEFADLMPALYQSDAKAQVAVGVGLNLSTAFVRSIYPSTKAFAAVPLVEQRDFLLRLEAAEKVFYENSAHEAGMATTLVRYWLAAVVEGEEETVRELEVHLDYFSRKPLEEETPARAG